MELLIVCKRVKQLVDIGWGVSAMALEIQVSLHKVTTLSRSPHTPCRGFHDEHLPIAATASPHIHTMRTPPFRSGICLRFAFQILLALGAQTPWAAPVAVHGDAGGGVLYEQNFVQTEHSAQTSFMPFCIWTTAHFMRGWTRLGSRWYRWGRAIWSCLCA